MGKPLDKSKRQENGAHEQEDQQEADAEVDMAIDTRSNPDVSEEAKKDFSNEHFEATYLRQVTESFADDIEKLRKAPDFKDSSVEVLIEALKQPAGNFSDEEKARWMQSS